MSQVFHHVTSWNSWIIPFQSMVEKNHKNLNHEKNTVCSHVVSYIRNTWCYLNWEQMSVLLQVNVRQTQCWYKHWVLTSGSDRKLKQQKYFLVAEWTVVDTVQYSPIAPLRTNSLSLQRLCGIEWSTEVNIFYWRVSTHQSWHLHCTNSCYSAASIHNVCVVQTYWMVNVEAATEPRGLADNMDQSGGECVYVEGFER